MEIQKSDTNKVESIYTKPVVSPADKIPRLLKITAGLMALVGFCTVISGMFGLSISVFFGLVFIIVGVLMMLYSLPIFKMRKKGYKTSLVLNGLRVALVFFPAIIPGVVVDFTGFKEVSSLIAGLFSMIVLYKYREKFVG